MEKIKEKYFYPMAVTVVSGRKDLPQEIASRWDRFDLLGEKEKMMLVSDNVPNVIKEIAIKFNLTPILIGEISRLIRDAYFGVVTLGDLSHELIRKIPSLSVANAQDISQILNKKIFAAASYLTDEFGQNNKKKACIQLSLLDAIKKYPKVAEQTVTINSLKLRTSQVPARPSIKNWLIDFHDLMGAKKHSALDRGNFLFHSENGKKLTPIERQKLAVILKSLDEEIPLTIDTDSQRILFEVVQAAQPTTTINDQQSPVTNMSSGQFDEPGAVQTQSQPVVSREVVDKAVFGNNFQEKKSDDFFQLPQSKPQIGSTDFFGQKRETVAPAEKMVEVEKESLEKPAQTKHANIFSDNPILRMFQGKKDQPMTAQEKFSSSPFARPQEINSEQKDFASNFGSEEGKISFSSAQKMPAEQELKIAQAPAWKAVEKQPFQQVDREPVRQHTEMFQQPAKQTYQAPFQQVTPAEPIVEKSEPIRENIKLPQMNPYRITPSGYKREEIEEDKKSVEPKVGGNNVVDLRG